MSSLQKVEKVLRLILFLSTGKGKSIEEIAEILDVSERSVFRYLESLRNAGLFIERKDKYYFLTKLEQNKFLSDLLHFSQKEAYLLSQAINSIEGESTILENLREKLYSLYKNVPYTYTTINKKHSEVIELLSTAIRNKQQVELIGYRSSNSQNIGDRLVEPFKFTTNFTGVWCLEPKTHLVKMFKTSRIEEVRILDSKWQLEELHIEGQPDPFRIYTNDRLPVKFKMSLLAYNLLCEEYPLARDYIRKISNNEYVFEAEVCSYAGVGRFVLGLLDEIEVLENPEFITYLESKILRKKFGC